MIHKIYIKNIRISLYGHLGNMVTVQQFQIISILTVNYRTLVLLIWSTCYSVHLGPISGVTLIVRSDCKYIPFKKYIPKYR